MAILVVRIEDVSTLLMNEFFDYNGRCYALTRSRKENTDVCINLEDFYEGTVQSESLEDIPVVFVKAQDGGWAVIGYYKRAEVRKKIMRPSLFLEGNIRADVREAWLFSEDERKQIIGVINIDTIAEKSDLGYMAMIEGNKRPDDIEFDFMDDYATAC